MTNHSELKIIWQLTWPAALALMSQSVVAALVLVLLRDSGVLLQGAYTLAFSWALTASALSSALCLSSEPGLSERRAQGNREELASYWSSALLSACWASLLAILILALGFGFLYFDEHNEVRALGLELFPWFIPTVVLRHFGILALRWLSVFNQNRLGFYFELMGGLIILALLFYLDQHQQVSVTNLGMVLTFGRLITCLLFGVALFKILPSPRPRSLVLRRKQAWEIVSVGRHTMVHYLFEVGAFLGALQIASHLGAAMGAAMGFVMSLSTSSFQFSLALSSAGAIRTGFWLGKGDVPKSFVAARAAMKLSVMSAIGFSALIALCFPFLSRWMLADETALLAADSVLVWVVGFQVVDSAQAVWAGVLRGLREFRVQARANAIGHGVGTVSLILLAVWGWHWGLFGLFFALTGGLTIVTLILSMAYAQIERRDIPK